MITYWPNWSYTAAIRLSLMNYRIRLCCVEQLEHDHNHTPEMCYPGVVSEACIT